MPSPLYAFGPFTVDPGSRRVTRGGEPVHLSDRYLDILEELLAHAGRVVSKELLIQAGWKDVAVTDNSLEQAISSLRKVLGRPDAGPSSFIETVPRRGYRLAVPVTRAVPRSSGEELEALLAPHRAFVEGRTALETLEPEAVERARRVFEEVVRASPDDASAHVGLANALTLQFEAVRTARASGRDLLRRALHHAQEACRLDPSSAEAWCVLGLAAHQARDTVGAVAAARRAAMLEPDNWRHHLRLAYVSWGEERLRAARRALQLFPGVALAHWLSATVYIARQALAEAEQELVAGAAAQDRQHEDAKFRGVGLHLLLGMLRLSQGDEPSALQEFERELSHDARSQIYAAQARANSWSAIGAVRWRQSLTEDALRAFDTSLEIIPGHPIAMAARAGVTGDPAARSALDSRLRQLREAGAAIEAAFADATMETIAGRPERAVAAIHAALEQRPAGSGGWTVPVDPFLNASAHPEAWEPVLRLLRSRAG